MKQRNCHDPHLVILLPVCVWNLVKMGGYRAWKKAGVNLLETQNVKLLKVEIWH